MTLSVNHNQPISQSTSQPICLAIDVMGGDDAPTATLKGVVLALKNLHSAPPYQPVLHLRLFGNDNLINNFLATNLPPELKPCVTVHPASDVVLASTKPAVAIMQRQSSMRLAIEAVAQGQAAGVVSAGNTGAYMALSKLILKSLPGIARPAIARAMPTREGRVIMLDLGANSECKAEHLMQFALMGSVYARILLNVNRPKIGLLNIGKEEVKGTAMVQEAARLCQQLHEDGVIDYYGFVEGDDLANNLVDVIVTDGFTGNIMLKAIEGTARLIGSFLREALTGSVTAKLGASLARTALQQFRARIDARAYNAAIFLGLNGIAVKSHGGTDDYGFACTIEEAYNLARLNIAANTKELLLKIMQTDDDQVPPNNNYDDGDMLPVLPA